MKKLFTSALVVAAVAGGVLVSAAPAVAGPPPGVVSVKGAGATAWMGPGKVLFVEDTKADGRSAVAYIPGTSYKAITSNGNKTSGSVYLGGYSAGTKVSVKACTQDLSKKEPEPNTCTSGTLIVE